MEKKETTTKSKINNFFKLKKYLHLFIHIITELNTLLHNTLYEEKDGVSTSFVVVFF